MIQEPHIRHQLKYVDLNFLLDCAIAGCYPGSWHRNFIYHIHKYDTINFTDLSLLVIPLIEFLIQLKDRLMTCATEFEYKGQIYDLVCFKTSDFEGNHILFINGKPEELLLVLQCIIEKLTKSKIDFEIRLTTFKFLNNVELYFSDEDASKVFKIMDEVNMELLGIVSRLDEPKPLFLPILPWLGYSHVIETDDLGTEDVLAFVVLSAIYISARAFIKKPFRFEDDEVLNIIKNPANIEKYIGMDAHEFRNFLKYIRNDERFLACLKFQLEDPVVDS